MLFRELYYPAPKGNSFFSTSRPDFNCLQCYNLILRNKSTDEYLFCYRANIQIYLPHKSIFVTLSHCSTKRYETKELHIPQQYAASDDDANVQCTLVGSIVSTLNLITISEDNIHAHEAKPTS